jgi:membrane protein YdbS with pleckstrin-like domain
MRRDIIIKEVINTNQERESREEKILTDNIPDHLHPNVKKYWLVSNFIGLSLLILFFAAPFILYAALFGGPLCIAVAVIAFTGIICLVLVMAIALVNIVYKNTTFLVKDDSLTVNKGVFFKFSRTVPFNRVQNVTIFKGPLERRFGISTVNISTAGYGFNRLQGIGNPELLRDIILKRVTRAKNNGL